MCRRPGGSCRLSDPAKQAALRSVFAGDCVVRAMTKYWQGHDGSCACGLAPETRGHISWECPGTVKRRLSLEAGHSHRNLAPLDVERELGLSLLDPVVEVWRADWLAPPAEPVAGWRARQLNVDASCRHPKLASIRTVGGAVVDGRGNVRGGVLPPGSTVAKGEALAIIEAYQH